MQKAPNAIHAATILRQMEDAGIDAEPYFNIVAASLLKRHGQQALTFARDAVERWRGGNDREGLELWEGVWRSLTARVAAAPDMTPATIH